MTQRVTISVIGGHKATLEMEQLAHRVGYIVAKVEAILICGGLDGVMREASKGAKEGGGLTIGLLPGVQKSDANPYIDIALPTTIGYARNAMVAASADIILALPGSHGTSSEISYGFVYGRPIIDLGGWKREGMIQVKDLDELEQVLRRLVKEIEAKHKQAYQNHVQKSDSEYA